MKFEDFLMQRNEEQRKRRDLEDEVIELQADLDKEHKLNRVLQCALHEPTTSSRPRVSSWLPIQMLLAEVTIVEQEILCLERKFEELKICLCQEKKQTNDWRLFQQQQHQQKLQMHYICRSGHRRKRRNRQSPLEQSFNSADFRSQRPSTERKTSLGSASDITTTSSSQFIDFERTSNGQSRKQGILSHKTSTEDPNRLSEDMINCLIGVFMKLNRPLAELNYEVSSTVPKLGLSCINSKGLVSKTSFNCKSSSNSYKTFLDPYRILPDIDGPVREVGPYKNFMQFTRSSLDMSRLPECFPTLGRLRVLMHKLSTIDLSHLTYKQKLAFWINIYNACIMHAYLQHGLPSTIDKQLTLMNKAALNVGGIILNALAIEHYILRHPYASKGEMDDKERLLWHAYGLGYPEPDVTFALCRGCWSSPALRVYTAKDVVNELGKAKVEFLEASVGITSKKKILVPKLLHWHMQDFADNTKSLLEWIYSQLPRSGAVKRLIMECLDAETRTPVTKMVEIQSYESEFRYLFPH
ncbi:hypothetical protein AQUCO_02700384v1 [Aquilegia coerulea]|uniref:DUF547 domain-containing protein n=1 Tax=Aquilegia coerulea TaxID=218851 RepID=A0A2G5D6M4_AQUCA|nr:hypothetical protein AQUCO_02700384v1 [Aquilegia coerulea]